MNNNEEVKQEVRVVDFAAIPVENIEGKIEKVNYSKIIGNLIYTNTKDLGEVELARRVYKYGSVEITKMERDAIRKYMDNFPIVVRQAIDQAMNF